MKHLFYIALAVWFTIAFTACSEYKRCEARYVMPDNAICKTHIKDGDGVIMMYYRFKDCDNGREYLNPENWKRIEICTTAGK